MDNKILDLITELSNMRNICEDHADNGNLQMASVVLEEMKDILDDIKDCVKEK